MAIRKTAVASAVQKEAKPVATPAPHPTEAKPILGIWDDEPTVEVSVTPEKEKELFKGKLRIVHWESNPKNPAEDIGWVKVALDPTVEHRGPATEQTVMRLKRQYGNNPRYIVDVDTRYNRYNVCVSEKVIVRLRPHVEE